MSSANRSTARARELFQILKQDARLSTHFDPAKWLEFEELYRMAMVCFRKNTPWKTTNLEAAEHHKFKAALYRICNEPTDRLEVLRTIAAEALRSPKNF